MKLEAPVQCPNCKKIHKIKFDNFKPGKSVKCTCGTILKFSGDDMSKAQKELDKLERSIANMFP